MNRIAPVIACSAVFFGISCLFIPLLGIQHDEALIAPALYTPASAIGQVNIGHTSVPTMLMTYVGAGKAWLYTLIFATWTPSPWSLRLPVVAIGVATIVLFFILLRTVADDRAALFGTALLATDPIFLLTTTFDWGPVAIQHVLMLVGTVLLVRKRPLCFWAFLAFGLMIWDKAISLWPFNALFITALMLFSRCIRRLLTIRRVCASLAGLLIGSMPLLVYNYQHSWSTLRDNATFSTEAWGIKLWILFVNLGGSGLYTYMIRTLPPPFFTATPILILLSAVLLLRRRTDPRTAIGIWGLLMMTITWLQMLATRDAGASAHHVVLLWPWAQLVIGTALAYRCAPRAAVGLISIAVATNVAMLATYYRGAVRDGPSVIWTDAIYRAAGACSATDNIIAIDWGITNPLMLLTAGRCSTSYRSVQDITSHDFETALFMSHVDGLEVFPAANLHANTAAETRGYRRDAVAIFCDRRGRPILMTFRYICSDL